MTRFLLMSALIVLTTGCDVFGIKAAKKAQTAAVQAEMAAREATEMALAAKLDAVRDQPKFGIRLLAWNIESNGSDSKKIKRQLDEMGAFDILALTEVSLDDLEQFVSYWSKESGIAGTTGGNDRMTIAWNPEKFAFIGSNELKEHAGIDLAPGMHRAPLVAHLKAKPDGREFMVLNNHLARGNAELRTQQAKGLVQWARDQSIPIIAVGGFNFDYDIPTKHGNEAFSAFLQDGIYSWVRPDEFIDTNWADHNGDGMDDYPDSMLDFVFVTVPAAKWKVTSHVIVNDGDFPDNETTSDHRPILTLVTW